MNAASRPATGTCIFATAILAASAILAGCTMPPDVPEGWTLVSLSPGADIRQAVIDAPPRTVIELAAGTFHLTGHAPYDHGVWLEGTTDLVIRGRGWKATEIRLPADLDIGFYMAGNVQNLAIEKLSIRGTLPLAINTHAFGNYTGPGTPGPVRGLRLSDLCIEDVAVGISIATHYEDSVYDDVVVTRNIIRDTVGTESGSGYGIHVDNPTNLYVFRNCIHRATRHSIYVGRAALGSNIRVERNFIFEHDYFGAHPLSVACAFATARSADVFSRGNVVLDSRTYAMSVEPDDVFGWPTDDVVLLGNRILGARSGGLWDATGGTVTVLGNTVVQVEGNPYADYAVELSAGGILAAPLPRWSGAQTRYDLFTEADGMFYILWNGRLDRVDPTDWSYTTAPGDWTGARFLASVPYPKVDRLYVGMADGAMRSVNAATLAYAEADGSWPVECWLESATTEWNADGSTAYRVDLWLDATRLPTVAVFMAEWDLVVPPGFVLLEARPPDADDFFEGLAMDADDERFVAATDGTGRSQDNLRLSADPFAGVRGRRGILASYWLAAEPGSVGGTITVADVVLGTTEFSAITEPNGLGARGLVITTR